MGQLLEPVRQVDCQEAGVLVPREPELRPFEPTAHAVRWSTCGEIVVQALPGQGAIEVHEPFGVRSDCLADLSRASRATLAVSKTSVP